MTSLKNQIKALEQRIEKENSILAEKISDLKPFVLIIGGVFLGISLVKYPKKFFNLLKDNLIYLQRYFKNWSNAT